MIHSMVLLAGRILLRLFGESKVRGGIGILESPADMAQRSAFGFPAFKRAPGRLQKAIAFGVEMVGRIAQGGTLSGLG
jgi:hypothetical protein